MSEFQTVARVGDIPVDQGRCFPVAGKLVGVFLHNSQYFAINDFCPHMGASLSEGHVEEGAVMCPWHAWRFSLSDGTWMDNSKGGIRTDSYAVRVVDSEIQVLVPADTAKPDHSSSATPCGGGCSPEVGDSGHAVEGPRDDSLAPTESDVAADRDSVCDAE